MALFGLARFRLTLRFAHHHGAAIGTPHLNARGALGVRYGLIALRAEALAFRPHLLLPLALLFAFGLHLRHAPNLFSERTISAYKTEGF
jgi:hypothetical protein